MKNAELIIFILVVMINGGIALWKKYAELKAKRAAEALARPSAMSRTPAPVQELPRRAPASRPAPVAAPRPAAKPTAKPKPKPKPKAQSKPAPKPTPKSPAQASAASPADRRPVTSAVAAAIAPRSATPVAASAHGNRWSGLLRGRNALRRAIVLREVLGPPRSLEPWKG